MHLLSYITWDPDPTLFHFNIPFLNRPLLWYGLFFAGGFILGYATLLYILRRFFHKEGRGYAHQFAEKLVFYFVIGTLVGARLGDLLFYQGYSALVKDPLSILAIWEGGLASHGGALGILVALLLFSRKYKQPFWRVLDFVVIPAAIGGACIRIGNLFNQEILGTPTQLPWGFLFLHPADQGPLVPRHPAQLYEALWYLALFIALFFYAKKYPRLGKPGRLTGMFLVAVFCFRFLIEFLKVEQSRYFSEGSLLTMGQYLSIPFLLLGIYLLKRRG
ncbi:MAG: prolipoprotein diacylglyceryl transferase [Verrucomicrobia bacterium]|nr:prolipoprotein diacylglyceryl transferase [Verrucomicrobiota bacterium]